MDDAARYRAPVEGDERVDSGSGRARNEPPGPPPSRGLAALLTLLCGSGLGHFYLGRRRRGVLWAGLPLTLFALSGLLLPGLSTHTGFLVFAVGGVALCFTRAAELIDLRFVRQRDVRRLPWWQLLVLWGVSVSYAVLVALLVRTQVLEAFKIPSGSMRPALQPQDHLLIDKTAFRTAPPQRGEIAVFHDPQHPTLDFVKRVIGLPGDRVDVRDGYAFINDWPVPHCTVADDVQIPISVADGGPELARGRLELEFLGRESYLLLLEDGLEAGTGPWSVSPGEYFVVGDNRMNSADSRGWYEGRGGGVPFQLLIGRPLFIWLAFAHGGEVDWPRVGQAVQGAHLPSALQALAPALASCLRRRPAQTEPPSP